MKPENVLKKLLQESVSIVINSLDYTDKHLSQRFLKSPSRKKYKESDVLIEELTGKSLGFNFRTTLFFDVKTGTSSVT